MIRVVAFFCAAVIVATDAQAQASLDKAVAESLSRASAYLRIIDESSGKPIASGTGFIFVNRDNSALLLTNSHVVSPYDRTVSSNPSVRIEAVLASGSTHERTLSAEFIAEDTDIDLAVLRVTGTGLPTAYKVARKKQAAGTGFVIGYPFGEALAATEASNPEPTISGARVMKEVKPAEGIIWLQIEGHLNPGNSGGALVDNSGELRGVAVASKLGKGVGFIIPNSEIARFLAGGLQSIRAKQTATVVSGAEATTDLEVSVQLSDPFEKLTGLEVMLVPVDGDRPPDFSSPSTVAPLKRSGMRAEGQLKVTGTANSVSSYWLAARATNGKGIKLLTEPAKVVIGFDEIPTSQAGAPAWISQPSPQLPKPNSPVALRAKTDRPVELRRNKNPDALAEVSLDGNYIVSGDCVVVLEEGEFDRSQILRRISIEGRIETHRAYLRKQCTLIGLNSLGVILQSEETAEVWALDPDDFSMKKAVDFPFGPIACAPRERSFVATRKDGILALFDLDTGKFIAYLREDDLEWKRARASKLNFGRHTVIRCSPNGEFFLAASSLDPMLVRFDGKSFSTHGWLPEIGSRDPIFGFDEGSGYLAFKNDLGVHVRPVGDLKRALTTIRDPSIRSTFIDKQTARIYAVHSSGEFVTYSIPGEVLETKKLANPGAHCRIQRANEKWLIVMVSQTIYRVEATK